MNKSAFIDAYINNLTKLEIDFLRYLEENDLSDDILQSIVDSIIESVNDKNEFRLILNIISSISQNHYRYQNFLVKIENILNSIQDEIKTVFSNTEIFEIFKYNKQIIVLLLEKSILIPNDSISDIITNDEFMKRSYPHYLYPEFKDFLDSYYKKSFENDHDDFYSKRLIGENDYYICQLIRKDEIEEFIIYVNQNMISLSSLIMPSIYETNSFLLDKYPTLLEYATFHGAIQIFNYLTTNGEELKPSLWLYAIHSKNDELICILEENKVEPPLNSFDICYSESIICHHHEITDYFGNSDITDKKISVPYILHRGTGIGVY